MTTPSSTAIICPEDFYDVPDYFEWIEFFWGIDMDNIETFKPLPVSIN